MNNTEDEKEKLREEKKLKWKPILDSLNLDDKKKSWLADYDIQHENNEILNTQVSTDDDTISFPSLLPIARKIAATITMDEPTLDEDSYTNEKRKRILDDIFDNRETDYNKLEDLKKDYITYKNGIMSVQPMSSPKYEINFLDYVYEPLKNNDMKE